MFYNKIVSASWKMYKLINKMKEELESNRRVLIESDAVGSSETQIFPV